MAPVFFFLFSSWVEPRFPFGLAAREWWQAEPGLGKVATWPEPWGGVPLSDPLKPVRPLVGGGAGTGRGPTNVLARQKGGGSGHGHRKKLCGLQSGQADCSPGSAGFPGSEERFRRAGGCRRREWRRIWGSHKIGFIQKTKGKRKELQTDYRTL